VSLPSLIKIANTLGVSLNQLVCDSIINGREILEGELTKTLSDCDELEVRVIWDMANALKSILRERIKVQSE
jgi:uncharacterized tellurite resistance protein B-like protein